MPRLNLRTKLLGTGLVLLAFTAAISALSIATISGAVDRGTTIYDDGIVPLNTLGERAQPASRGSRSAGPQALLAGKSISAEDAAAIEKKRPTLDAMILGNEGDEGTLSDEEAAVIEAYQADFATPT